MALQVGEPLAGDVADLLELERPQGRAAGPKAVDVVELARDVDRRRARPTSAIGLEASGPCAVSALDLDDRQLGAADRCRRGRRRGRLGLHHRQLLRGRGDDPARRLADRLRGGCVGLGRGPAATPVSACSRRSSESGTLPSRGTSSSSARSWPPPSPKIVKRWPSGVVKPDMFSITPSSSRSTLAGHLGRAAGDRLGGRLRGGDDHDPRLRQQLGERHRDVAGPGRQVEQQVVELVPGDVLEELLDRLVEHRARARRPPRCARGRSRSTSP